MRILVLNSGGSSMKYALIDMNGETTLARGMVDRLGTDRAVLTHESTYQPRTVSPVPGMQYATGITMVVNRLVKERVVASVDELAAFAHKVAHGGEELRAPVIVTDAVTSTIAKCGKLAPVHNPPSLNGIETCRELFPDVPQAVVFETAFHQTVPDYAFIYGVPYAWYEKHGVRKYGFHGASHTYVVDQVSKLVGRPRNALKIVSCHLGSGTSVAAIKFGKSVDVSSGFTPQSGTMMSTRPGDFDPWVFPYLMEQEGLSAEDLSKRLVTEGGLAGISGVGGDMRDILQAAQAGNDRARLAVDAFCYCIKKYIGSYAAVMNGLDVLCFTGGIGERSPEIRERIAADMEFIGIQIDAHKNFALGAEVDFSSATSRVRVIAIATNEELVVARMAAAVLDGNA